MRIFIDWKNEEWYDNKESVIDRLIADELFDSFNDWLLNEYGDCLEKLLSFSEEEKKEVYNQYEEDVNKIFEECIEGRDYDITVLEIDSDTTIEVKQI